MITRSRGGGASNMECDGNEGGVPLSMIPLLEVAYSKCQEEEDSVQGQVQKGAWLARQEQEEAGKKRKRSSNWSEAETLQLLLLRKGQLQNKEERKSCPKGSSAWDEIASQLKEKFTPRSGKHVGERWDTLRRVYMDIEEHCSKTQETYAEVLDANRDSFKFIPTEYTQKWHELIADCKPGKRRGKKMNENSSVLQKVVTPLSLVQAAPSRTEPAAGDYSNIAPLETCPVDNLTQSRLERAPANAAHIKFVPSESSPTSVAQPSGIASAFGTLIKDIERILSCHKDQDKSGQICKKNCAKVTGDERAEANGVELADDMRCDAKVNVVASLQSVLSALKSASEFTNSESYLLKIDKREFNLVEHNVRAFAERTSCCGVLRAEPAGPLPRVLIFFWCSSTTSSLHEPSALTNMWDWTIYGILSMNSWIWSTVFHSRDMKFTERLDYSSAIALIGYALMLTIIRTGNMRAEAAPVMVAAPIIAFISTHILYLNLYTFDYDLKMVAPR